MGQVHEFVWITLGASAGGCVFAGLVVIVDWIVERRRYAANRPIRDAALVAQAMAEVRK